MGFVVMGLISAPLYAFLLNRENMKKDAELNHQNSLPDSERRQYTVQ